MTEPEIKSLHTRPTNSEVEVLGGKRKKMTTNEDTKVMTSRDKVRKNARYGKSA